MRGFYCISLHRMNKTAVDHRPWEGTGGYNEGRGSGEGDKGHKNCQS